MSKNDCVIAVVEMNNHFALVKDAEGNWDFPTYNLSKGEAPSADVAKKLAFNRASLVTGQAHHLGVRDAGQGSLAAYYLLDGVNTLEVRNDVYWFSGEEVKQKTHQFNPLWNYIGRLEKV